LKTADAFNEDQRTRWNGADGEYWATRYDRLDLTLAPVMGPLMEFAAPVANETVMDVGCGCGATTVELARAVGSTGRVIGIDVSESMLEVARQRVSTFRNTTCLLGDAKELSLVTIKADLVVSRFGVMFFGDPVAAFANLKTGLRAGGRLRFVCWRTVAENPWLHLPLKAAYEHVPRLPAPAPEEPGPFSFSDPERVRRILANAGFAGISFTPLDVELDLSAGGTIDDAVRQASEMGPTKRALAEQPDEVRAAAVDEIRKVLTPHVSIGGVKLAGAVWLVAAKSDH
jgi:SAM-dependent methyltransferase